MAQSTDLLHTWKEDQKYGDRQRGPSAYNPLYSYRLPQGDKRQYAQQFSDLYFLRLQKLKSVVQNIAAPEWEDFEIAGEKAKRVDRVLDVRQGELSWVVGTIYMDLPLKPNVLEDVSRDHFISGPPPRTSYYMRDNEPEVMLEDRSGRLRLAGAMLKQNLLVTGVIMAVLGTENANGDFEVLDIHIPDLPPQPPRWKRDDEDREEEDGMKVDRSKVAGKKIAFVSGLEISGTDADTLTLSMLTEYLLGEALGDKDQDHVTSISRLVIAGNSIAPDVIDNQPAGTDEAPRKIREKKYGYDATAYNPAPTAHLDDFISELLPTIPVTIMAGEYDPANYGLPQQPIHPAMFPHSRQYAATNLSHPEEEEPGWFESVTNPWDGDIEGWRMLGTSGQPVDDILKYVDLGGPNGTDAEGRLEVMESMLRWRSSAPTAPDTLWSYPFQDRDPFVLSKCPHVYFVGNQPRFDTTTIEGPSGQQVRLFTIPRFHDTGEIILLDTETLECEIVCFEVETRIHATLAQDAFLTFTAQTSKMLFNEKTALHTDKLVLVPYCELHVRKYHRWMKDPDLQAATASEPLSLVEEYQMQQSWRADSDKLTFIACHPHTTHVSFEEVHAMLGDVNLFILTNEEENGDILLVGELELMIASKEDQRQGNGRATLLIFLYYVLRHQDRILEEYFTLPRAQAQVTRLAYFRVKIKETNARSITLFESLGFKKTEPSPNFFEEFELRNDRLKLEQVEAWLQQRNITNYKEVPYLIRNAGDQQDLPGSDSITDSSGTGSQG